MNPITAREKLNLFFDTLPDSAFLPLRDKNLDPGMLTSDITSAHDFVIKETGSIFEGVLRILKGEDSPADLVAFIEKDQNIDEENRTHIPQIAYEIQTKIFDAVFPIFKEAGLPLKEGRVPIPPPPPPPPVVSPYGAASSSISPIIGAIPTTAPSAGVSLPATSYELRASPMEEKNVRALVRIAAGTNYTEGQLRDAFEGLPVGLRQAISSVDTANAIQEIAKKYLLHVDQMGALASETGLVLLGLTHPAEFIKNLASRLRLPDERAREIARDISAQVLVKVREALRGLHEVKPASEYPNIPNQRMDTNKKGVEPLKKIDVMPSPLARGALSYPAGGVSAQAAGEKQPPKAIPFGKGITTPALADSATPFSKGDLPKATTPFSPSAKWNTGDNILKKQAEEKLSREDVLRGIENPDKFKVSSSKLESQLKTNNLELQTRVGPTGWRPPANIAPDLRNLSKYPINKLESVPPKPPTSPFDAGSTTPVPHFSEKVGDTPFSKGDRAESEPLAKTKPADGGATFPPKPETAPKDFVEQKLQQPMSLPKEEKRYTTDPYREPLGS